MNKKIIGFGIAVMATLLSLAILWQFHIVIVYVLVSITIAATIRPVVNRLKGRGLVQRIAWILAFLAILGSIGLLIFFSSKTSIQEIQQLANTVSVQDKWRLPYWLQGTTFENALLPRLPQPSKLFQALTGEHGQLVLPTLLGFTQDLAGTISAVFVILFLSIYWIINQVNFERLWLSLLQTEHRKRARGIWRNIERDLGAYIRTQLVYSLMAGMLFGLGYWLLGSPYPALLALTGALACLIPVVGVVLAILPPFLIGLLTGPELSIFTMLYTILILIILGIWVKPRLFKRQWDNPILTIITLMIMANAFGFIGILIAPPVSAIFQILWHILVSHRYSSAAASQVSDLRERHTKILETIQTMAETPPVITSSMARLTELINQAAPVLQKAMDTADQRTPPVKF